MSNQFAAIVGALEAIIEGAPEADRDRLAAAIERYCTMFPRSWLGMTQKKGSLGDLLNIIADSSDARVGWAITESR